MSKRSRFSVWSGAAVAMCLSVWVAVPTPAGAQVDPDERGTRNLKLLANVPLGGALPRDSRISSGLPGLGLRTGRVELEQELTRPFAYVTRRFAPTGFDVVNLQDPEHARRHFRWTLEGSEGAEGDGAVDGKYFKVGPRYFYAVAFRFQEGGAYQDLAAVVLDVTSLPDTSGIREVARLQGPEHRGGIHGLFAYKHSSGRTLLFAAGAGETATVYDAERLVQGDTSPAGRVPTPDVLLDTPLYGRGYQDVFVGFHPASQQDRFYGSGAGGFFVYDVTDLARPTLLASVSGVAGLRRGYSAQPSPDGQYLVGEMAFRNMPLHIFDLEPGLEGRTQQIRRPVGAWTADWRNFAHRHQVRWPYLFVASLEEGLQVVNLMDPTEPYTMGYYYTWDGPKSTHLDGDWNVRGAWDVQVRNADGLIVVSDVVSGLWVFRMDGFPGWNGRRWGYPNVSSAQDWDEGPDGVVRGDDR